MNKNNLANINPLTKLHIYIDGDGNPELSMVGTKRDLINAIACACDFKEVRDILYSAVDLDREHEQKVGRRFNLSFKD